MRFVQQKEKRKVYVERAGDDDIYVLSPLPQVVAGLYRPLQQFNREELDKFLAGLSNVEVIWQ